MSGALVMRVSSPPLLACLAAGMSLALPGCGTATPANPDRVGRVEGWGIVTPVNQVLTPLGRVIELPGLRPQGLALSPDGRLLVVSGKTNELVVLDPAAGTIRQRVTLLGDTGEPTPGAVSTNILE